MNKAQKSGRSRNKTLAQLRAEQAEINKQIKEKEAQEKNEKIGIEINKYFPKHGKILPKEMEAYSKIYNECRTKIKRLQAKIKDADTKMKNDIRELYEKSIGKDRLPDEFRGIFEKIKIETEPKNDKTPTKAAGAGKPSDEPQLTSEG